MNFKYLFSARPVLSESPDMPGPRAESTEMVSIELPRGRPGVSTSSQGDVFSLVVISAAGTYSVTFTKLPVGPDQSTYWVYRMVSNCAGRHMDMYVGDDVVSWLRRWAVPPLPSSPRIKYGRGEEATVIGKITPGVYTRSTLSDLAFNVTGSVVTTRYDFPIDDVIIDVRTQCCGQTPCACESKCVNQMRVGRWVDGKETELLRWVDIADMEQLGHLFA